jgi:hypothetical protein
LRLKVFLCGLFRESFLIQVLLKFGSMGKTGSIEWVKIKGRKGQVRQVAKAETVYKKPGPMQKYASTGARIKKIKRSEKATSIRT